tara:strand:+ start:246 stop:1121 length:876 start_codon:yes stop_codon:yes gene_type:complete
MSADKRNNHSRDSITRVIAKNNKTGYFQKIFGSVKGSPTQSVIVEKDGKLELIKKEEKKSYLKFSGKLKALFGKHKIYNTIIDHDIFEIIYRFKQDDEYPLITQNNEIISALFTIQLRVNPDDPTIFFQSFKNNKNVSIEDVYKILNQRIRTTVQNSINEFDSSTIRSESFNESFFNNLIPQLREQARILGLEIASWTPPMYGLSRQEEKLIELSELEHKKRIAKLEEEIRLIKESPKKEMGDKNLNITNQNVNTGYIGRDFKVSDNFINKKLLVVLGIIISLVTIIYSVI